MTDTSLAASRDNSNPREAGAPESEITPEMINAGVRALLEFDRRFEEEADAVVNIFRAMSEAKG